MNRRILPLAAVLTAGVSATAQPTNVAVNPPVIVHPCNPPPCVHTTIPVMTAMDPGVDWVSANLVGATIAPGQPIDVVFHPLSEDLLPPAYHPEMMPEEIYATFFTTPNYFPNQLNPGPVTLGVDGEVTEPNVVSGVWWEEPNSIDLGAEFTLLQLAVQQPMALPPLTLIDTGVLALTVELTITTQEPNQPEITSPTLSFEIFRETGAGPYNNDCTNAVRIFEGAAVFTTENATTDGPDEPNDCDWAGYSDIDSDTWFRYIAAHTGDLIVSLCGSAFDTKLAVYEAGCPIGPGEVLACNDDFCDLQSEVTLGVLAGQEYLIRVGGYLGAEGEGDITISYAPPANDDCADAVPVFASDTLNGTLAGATNDGDASCGAPSTNPDAWYSYTASEEGVLRVNTCGTHDGAGVDQGMDTVLSLHDNCPGFAGAELDCNDDWWSSDDPAVCSGMDAGLFRDSAVSSTMNTGETVLIRVSHYGGSLADGQYALNVDFAPPVTATPHVAGDFQGWDPASDPMTETAPGSNIWERTYAGLVPGGRYEFKITNGLAWNDPDHFNWPTFNSWCFADQSGAVLITYDDNVYSDGRLPAIRRLPLPDYCDPETWTAVGDFQGWDPSNPATAMWPMGDNAYTYVTTGLSPGTHWWKAVVACTWDSISWDSRSVTAADMPFEISCETDILFLEVYPLDGTVRAVTRVGGACCFWDEEYCEITEPDECVYMGGDFQGDNVPCSPGLCVLDCPGDVDIDGDTDLSDLAALLASYGECVGDPTFIPEADFDDDGCVTLSDLAHLLGDYGCGD